MDFRGRYLEKVALEQGRAWTCKESGSIFQGGADNRTMSRSVGPELYFLEKRKQ